MPSSFGRHVSASVCACHIAAIAGLIGGPAVSAAQTVQTFTFQGLNSTFQDLNTTFRVCAIDFFMAMYQTRGKRGVLIYDH